MSGPPPEAEWYRLADEDLRLAWLAHEAQPPLPRMVCYHSQQAAEKWMKGFLVAQGRTFRYVHDLVYLHQLCAAVDPSLDALAEAAEVLAEYALGARYPMATERSVDDAADALTLAEQFREVIVR